MAGARKRTPGPAPEANPETDQPGPAPAPAAEPAATGAYLDALAAKLDPANSHFATAGLPRSLLGPPADATPESSTETEARLRAAARARACGLTPAVAAFLATVETYGLGPGVGECQDAWTRVVDERESGVADPVKLAYLDATAIALHAKGRPAQCVYRDAEQLWAARVAYLAGRS